MRCEPWSNKWWGSRDGFGFHLMSETLVLVNAFQKAPMRMPELDFVEEEHLGQDAEIQVWFQGATSCGIRLHDVCSARAVSHWKSLWFARTVRRRLRRGACEVMQLTSRYDADATALVQSFL